MLITPAMASEPYWAAAPSRNTSIRSIAAAGIAFKSTPTVPRPNVPFTCTSAGGCRRLPLTSTSTWSGPRPRRLAGLMWSEPSAMVWWDALNDGASVARIWFTSVWPVSCTSWEVMTSTGTGVSTAVRDVRAPTTTTSLSESGVAVSLKSTVIVCPARTTTRSSAASWPMSRARTLCAPAGTLRRYCPFSLVRTLRAVPTTTTLAPTSGAPDSVATTGPETVPVCCATSGTKGTTNRNAMRSGRTGVESTGHLLGNDGLQVQVWASNTARRADGQADGTTIGATRKPGPTQSRLRRSLGARYLPNETASPTAAAISFWNLELLSVPEKSNFAEYRLSSMSARTASVGPTLNLAPTPTAPPMSVLPPTPDHASPPRMIAPPPTMKCHDVFPARGPNPRRSRPLMSITVPAVSSVPLPMPV